jgi:predicted nuclease of predicted toxin-antitoxin system
MRVLLDENLPHKLRGLLPGHDVRTVAYMNWVGIKNGELLRTAEEAGFEILVTSDQGILHEQNLAGRKLAIIMLSTPDWNLVGEAAPLIAEALTAAVPGSFTRVECGAFNRRKPKRSP